MSIAAFRFVGEVTAPGGGALGEARFWASVEHEDERAEWRGWLHVTDLRTNELPAGRYTVRSPEGWEAHFEPIASRPSRVFEIDLLPIRGVGEPPPVDGAEQRQPPAIPFSDDRPSRTADDRTRFPDLAPLTLGPREGLLPPDLPWPAIPEP